MPGKYGMGVLRLSNSIHARQIIAVDADTGFPVEGVVIRSQAQVDAYRNRVNRDLGYDSQRLFVVTFHKALITVLRKMTLTQAGVIMRLLPHIKHKESGRIDLSAAEIAETVDKSRKHSDDALNALCELGVLRKERISGRVAYFAEPAFHTHGVTVPTRKKFTKTYKDGVSTLMADVPLETAGFVYKLQPFVHKDLCFISKHADVDVEGGNYDIGIMTVAEMSDAIGVDVSTVKRHLRECRKAGVMIRMTTLNREGYVVHPDLLLRQDHRNRRVQTIRDIFGTLDGE